MEVPSFADISLDKSNPLQIQLHDQLLNKIASGHLSPGMRLPSSRRIAEELGISRNTVLIVLEQLKAEGFVESRQGSGIRVKQELPDGGVSQIQWRSFSELPGLSSAGQRFQQAAHPQDIDALPFSVGLPDARAFPEAIWLKLQRRHQDRRLLRSYDSDQGYRPLREALVHYLKSSRGVRCEADQIIITQGAQQALALCALVLLNETEGVMVENPGYGGAVEAFKTRNARFFEVPLGRNGIDIARLPEQAPARLLYTTPTHQYPLGGILPAAERLQLLDWAARNRIWILEDDYDSEFHFYSKPIAALQGMAPQTPVLYVGSFSKTLFPSLRLGYLVVPSPLVSALVAAKHALGGETPLVSQATTADFIEEGHFVRHLRRMRQLYQSKWEDMQQLVDEYLRGLARPVARSAGMHLALTIEKSDDSRLARAFRDVGYGSTPLSHYYLNARELQGKSEIQRLSGLVLGFANTTEQERRQGIKLLRQLLLRN